VANKSNISGFKRALASLFITFFLSAFVACGLLIHLVVNSDLAPEIEESCAEQCHPHAPVNRAAGCFCDEKLSRPGNQSRKK
jgi:hypothetical protein